MLSSNKTKIQYNSKFALFHNLLCQCYGFSSWFPLFHYLSVTSAHGLFKASTVPSSVCYVTMVSPRCFHCFIICRLCYVTLLSLQAEASILEIVGSRPQILGRGSLGVAEGRGHVSCKHGSSEMRRPSRRRVVKYYILSCRLQEVCSKVVTFEALYRKIREKDCMHLGCILLQAHQYLLPIADYSLARTK